MSDPQAPLRNFKRTQDFFVGIDSDGCAFDTMEVKHKECDESKNSSVITHLKNSLKFDLRHTSTPIPV
jgi:hypothetical protein